MASHQYFSMAFTRWHHVELQMGMLILSKRSVQSLYWTIGLMRITHLGGMHGKVCDQAVAAVSVCCSINTSHFRQS